MMLRASALWIVLVGCGDAGDDEAPTADAAPAGADGGGQDAGLGAPDAAAGDGGDVGDPDGGVDPYAAIRAEVDATYAANEGEVSGIRLRLYDGETDELLLDHEAGAFAADARVAIASASKLVSGLVLLRLIEGGLLALDTTTGEILGWQDDLAGITLEQLGAFVSGFAGDSDCNTLPQITLEECVDRIHDAGLAFEPGTTFDYGSTHLAIAARMAEVQTGLVWNDVFAEQLAAPLGLAGLEYYTLPNRSLGTQNPLVAGGLRASMDDYARFLALIAHEGERDGVRLVAPELVQRLFENHFVDAEIEGSPMQSLGFDRYYGWADWLECDGAVPECAVASSPGAFGFTPWVDRDLGVYGIVGMEGGAARIGSPLSERVRALLREARE